MPGTPSAWIGTARIGPISQLIVPAAAQPAQLAAVIARLLGDDSATVNGAVLPSGGGWSVI